MSDRMNTMFNQADTFIALPGGPSTLEEIFHISSWAQLHIHHKPIGLLNVNGFYDNLVSLLDQAMEHKFLTSSAWQIIIFAAEQLIDQLQSFILVLDPSMSRINWSTMESCKKLRLDLSLRLWNFVSFSFINSIIFVFCCFLYLFKCVSGLSVVAISGDVFYTLSFCLRTLRTMFRFGWGKRVVVDIKKK